MPFCGASGCHTLLARGTPVGIAQAPCQFGKSLLVDNLDKDTGMCVECLQKWREVLSQEHMGHLLHTGTGMVQMPLYCADALLSKGSSLVTNLPATLPHPCPPLSSVQEAGPWNGLSSEATAEASPAGN
jgi:hypothetical protein